MAKASKAIWGMCSHNVMEIANMKKDSFVMAKVYKDHLRELEAQVSDEEEVPSVGKIPEFSFPMCGYETFYEDTQDDEDVEESHSDFSAATDGVEEGEGSGAHGDD